jgi:hypothetical protein
MYVDVTETYEIIVDANDEEEACEDVYNMAVSEIMEGNYIESCVDVTDYNEIPFTKEDLDE